MITNMTRPEYRKSLAESVLAGKGIAGFGGVTYGGTDAWFAGGDQRVTCVVWIGHDKDAPIGKNVTAAETVLPVWSKIMKLVTDGKPMGWHSRSDMEDVLPIVKRAMAVEDFAVSVRPASPVVVGNDVYRAASEEKAITSTH